MKQGIQSSIENLNIVQDMRDFLIGEILYVEGKGLSIHAYDLLYKRLLKYQFKTLDRRVTKYIGNWRLQFGEK